VVVMEDNFAIKCDLCGKISESVFAYNGWQVLCYYCMSRYKEEWQEDSGRSAVSRSN